MCFLYCFCFLFFSGGVYCSYSILLCQHLPLDFFTWHEAYERFALLSPDTFIYLGRTNLNLITPQRTPVKPGRGDLIDGPVTMQQKKMKKAAGPMGYSKQYTTIIAVVLTIREKNTQTQSVFHTIREKKQHTHTVGDKTANRSA